jgi:phosphonate transport system permease protein
VVTTTVRASAGYRTARPLQDVHGRGALTLLLLAALLWSLLQVEWQDGVLRVNGLRVLASVMAGLLRPDLSAEVLATVARAAWITTVYAVAGLTLALALGLPLGILASGVLLRGRARRAAISVGRGVLAALRAVHELVWAWLFVAALGLSPFAAVFALALPYAGVLGRIYADLLNDVPEPPLTALRASGAGEAQVLIYGRLPAAAPDMLAYTFYRFECAIRSSAIMGFVGLGGLGLQIQLAVSDLRFSVVGTALLAMIVLIAAIEAWSGVVRRDLAI